MAYFSRQAQARIVLFSILSTVILSFQNCGTQSDITYEQSAAYSSHSIELLPSEILSTATPKIAITEAADAINTSLYSLKFQISGIDISQIKSIKCQLDNGTQQICSNQSFTADVATDGDHQIKIFVVTRAGISSEVTKLFRKDTTGPTIQLVNVPKPMSNETSALITFIATDSLVGVDRVECSLNAADFKTCTSPLTLVDLKNGDHGLRLIAYDKLGNKSDISSIDWTVDLIAPTLSLNQTPANPTNSPAATFDFSGGGVTKYECQLDNLAYSICTAPKTYSGLASGTHTFKVRGTSGTGNVSQPVTYTWSIDLSTPTIMFGQVPTNPTNSTSASFTFSGAGVVAYECKFDNGSYQACTSPKNYSGLASGNHTFTVRGKNNVGTYSNPVVHSWVIDTAPVFISISQTPAALTNSTSAVFSFTSATAIRYECSLNGSAYITCPTPYTLSNLPERTHTLNVRGFNNVGTASSVSSFNWIIDITKPTTPLPTLNITSPTNQKSIQITFSSSDTNGISSYQCYIEGESTEAPCTSPFSFTTVDDGNHRFHVKSIDGAGNVSVSSSISWSVDITPPEIPFVNSDLSSEPSRSKSVNFNFSATDSQSGISHYICVLDASIGNSLGWNPCSSPKLIENLANGQHTFDVLAVDKAGNTSEAKRISFSVQINIFTAIASGGHHACGITSNKTVRCSGWNGYGQLGNATTDDYVSGGTKTVDVQNLTNVTAISSGGYHSCVLADSGKVKCWGLNSSGNLGVGTNVNSSVPVDVPGISNAKAVSAGGNHTCIITSGSKVKCWGENAYGELGNGTLDASSSPVDVQGLTNVTSIYTSLWYSCAITGGALKCWGNLKGHLSGSDNSTVPADATALTGLKSACLGTGHTCVIGSDDKAKCWGNNSKGQLGNNSLVASSSAVDVSGLEKVKSISCYSDHTCAVTMAGVTKCWGDNSSYQLGDGTKINSPIPVEFKPTPLAIQASAGQTFSCALNPEGHVSCFGNILSEW
jgi:hypothetical protein